MTLALDFNNTTNNSMNQESNDVPYEKDTLPATLCCNYISTVKLGFPVYFNEGNKVVQCHNCGHVWEPIKMNGNAYAWPVTQMQ